MIIINILLVIAAYLLGSIPSSVWIGKKFYGIDVREHGSKNAGATNTLRILGRRAAAPVFILDFMKGFCAVKLFHLSSIAPDANMMFMFKMLLVVAVVAGHIFPIFARFRGGKGVATVAGSILAIYTLPLVCSFGVFIVVFLITNYVSLGSIISAIMFPVFLIFVFNERSIASIIFGCVAAVLLVLTHLKNIKRLMNGTESKVYPFKRSADNTSSKLNKN